MQSHLQLEMGIVSNTIKTTIKKVKKSYVNGK